MSGVRIKDLVIGKGRAAAQWDTVIVRYDLSLNRGDRVLDSFEYSWQLGDRHVVAGLDYGLIGMYEGGHRRLIVSPHLGYRDKGLGTLVPPGAVLIFEVDLLRVLDGDEEPLVGRVSVPDEAGGHLMTYADYILLRTKNASNSM